MNQSSRNFLNRLIESAALFDLSDPKSIIDFSTLANDTHVSSEYPHLFEEIRELAKGVDGAVSHGFKNIRDILVIPLTTLLKSFKPSSDEKELMDYSQQLSDAAFEIEKHLDSITVDSDASFSEKIAGSIRNTNRPRFMMVNEDPVVSIKLYLQRIKAWMTSMIPAIGSKINVDSLLGQIDWGTITFATAKTIAGAIASGVGMLAEKAGNAFTKTIAILDDVALFLQETKFPWSITNEYRSYTLFQINDQGNIDHIDNSFIVPEISFTYSKVECSLHSALIKLQNDRKITFTTFKDDDDRIVHMVTLVNPNDDMWEFRFALANAPGQYSDLDRFMTLFTGLPLKRHILDWTTEDSAILYSTGLANVTLNGVIAAATASGFFQRIFAGLAAAAATAGANAYEMTKFYSNYIGAAESLPYIDIFRGGSPKFDIPVKTIANPEFYWVLPWSDFKLISKIAKMTVKVLTGVAAGAAISVAAGRTARNIHNIVRNSKVNRPFLKKAKNDVYDKNGKLIQAAGERRPEAYAQKPDGSFALDSKGNKIPLRRSEIKKKIAYSSFLTPGKLSLISGSLGAGGLISSIMNKKDKTKESLRSRAEAKKTRDDLKGLEESNKKISKQIKDLDDMLWN